MKIKKLAEKEEELREVSLLVDIMHYLKLNRQYMDEKEFNAFCTVIEYLGNQEVDEI